MIRTLLWLASLMSAYGLLDKLPEITCNTSFLIVTLHDAFGDGWGDAWWYLRDPIPAIQQEQSTCDEVKKFIYVGPCEHGGSGPYYMTVQTPDDSLPEGWWEIYWKVAAFNVTGEPLGLVAYGKYNTSMIWTYDGPSDTWSLTLVDNEPDFECTGCSGGPCKPKPKPQKKKDDKKRLKKGKDSEDTESTESNSTQSDTNSSIFKYGPRAVDLTVKMISPKCNGWDWVTPFGAHWYIADWSMTKLFDDGSLCDREDEDVCEGICRICLGDGSYVFRVTGPAINKTELFTSWEFCHAQGGFNDQLTFHVKKGKCYPDDLLYVDDICDQLETSSVVLNGIIALGGLHTEIFNSVDNQAVLSVVSSVVTGWTTQNMEFLGTSLDARNLMVNTRMLNTYTHDIMFSVSFLTEDFGVDGTLYANIQNLVHDMASTLEVSIESGAFVQQLVHVSTQTSNSMLGDVTAAELIKLEVYSVRYSQSKLVYYADDQDSYTMHSNSDDDYSMSTTMIVIIAAVCSVAFIAFVGIATHTFNGYKKVSQVTESEHEQQLAMARSPFMGLSQQPTNRYEKIPIQI
jgi:hypothetical protein